MTARLQDFEDKPRRQQIDQGDAGILYVRFYNLPPDMQAIIPAEGQPMPGEPAALLGPFIERNGISITPERDKTPRQITLRCRLLKAR